MSNVIDFRTRKKVQHDKWDGINRLPSYMFELNDDNIGLSADFYIVEKEPSPYEKHMLKTLAILLTGELK